MNNTFIAKSKSITQLRNTYTGIAFGSFGEVIQGKKTCGEDFLITLPIDLWSVSTLTIKKVDSDLIINCNLQKSREIIKLILSKFQIKKGYEINVSINTNIPVGKGLSSSTADMYATLRALEYFLNFKFDAVEVSKIFNKVEPHDALMYNTCVLYNHRKGILLNKFDYIPKFKLIIVDFGGQVDTISYNNRIKVPIELMHEYDVIYNECIHAFNEKDDYKIARCATESLNIFLKFQHDSDRKQIFDNYEKFEAMGLVNTHSGTCLAFIYPDNISQTKLEVLQNKIQKEFNHLTYTLNILNNSRIP